MYLFCITDQYSHPFNNLWCCHTLCWCTLLPWYWRTVVHVDHCAKLLSQKHTLVLIYTIVISAHTDDELMTSSSVKTSLLSNLVWLLTPVDRNSNPKIESHYWSTPRSWFCTVPYDNSALHLYFYKKLTYSHTFNVCTLEAHQITDSTYVLRLVITRAV